MKITNAYGYGITVKGLIFQESSVDVINQDLPQVLRKYLVFNPKVKITTQRKLTSWTYSPTSVGACSTYYSVLILIPVTMFINRRGPCMTRSVYL